MEARFVRKANWFKLQNWKFRYFIFERLADENGCWSVKFLKFDIGIKDLANNRLE